MPTGSMYACAVAGAVIAALRGRVVAEKVRRSDLVEVEDARLTGDALLGDALACTVR